jgi:hypothetical protein
LLPIIDRSTPTIWNATTEDRPTPRPIVLALYPLAANAQFLNQNAVTIDIDLLKVLKQSTSTTYHQKQSATTVVVMLVRLKMLSQMIDATCKNCYLNLWATSVAFKTGVLCHERFFV